MILLHKSWESQKQVTNIQTPHAVGHLSKTNKPRIKKNFEEKRRYNSPIRYTLYTIPQPPLSFPKGKLTTKSKNKILYNKITTEFNMKCYLNHLGDGAKTVFQTNGKTYTVDSSGLTSYHTAERTR